MAQEVPCQKTGMYQIVFELVNAPTPENNSTLFIVVRCQGLVQKIQSNTHPNFSKMGTKF